MNSSFIISSRHVAFETLRHSSWLMSSTARSKQMAHGRAIFKLRPIRDSRPEFMTGAARVGSGRQENKFPVRIDARSIGDLSQRAPMFRMAGATGSALRRYIAMQRCDGRRRPAFKIATGVAVHTSRGTRTMKRFVALCAGRNIGMVAAQVSRSPEGRRMPP